MFTKVTRSALRPMGSIHEPAGAWCAVTTLLHRMFAAADTATTARKRLLTRPSNNVKIGIVGTFLTWINVADNRGDAGHELPYHAVILGHCTVFFTALPLFSLTYLPISPPICFPLSSFCYYRDA